MYRELVTLLSEAKKSNEPATLRRALLLMIEMFDTTLAQQMDYRTFGSFIHDEDFLLSADREVFYQDRADVRIVTSGLIDQLLEIIGVSNHSACAGVLKNTLYDLHAVLSRGISDTHREQRAFKKALDDLRLAVE